MFEKHKNSKPEPANPQASKPTVSVPASEAASRTSSTGGSAAVIGRDISITGDISGSENLMIEGRVDGKILLDNHEVDIGESGKVNADITAKVIRIAGEVRGDLTGTEKVIISASGNVHGNIVAPRMTLEDGAIFKGSIDMDPGEPSQKAVAKTIKSAVEHNPETAKVLATGQ